MHKKTICVVIEKIIANQIKLSNIKLATSASFGNSTPLAEMIAMEIYANISPKTSGKTRASKKIMPLSFIV